MLLRHGFVVLTQKDGSPAIMREDRIRKIQSLTGGRTKIYYANDREYIVKEDAFIVNNMILEAHEKTMRLKGLKEEWI